MIEVLIFIALVFFFGIGATWGLILGYGRVRMYRQEDIGMKEFVEVLKTRWSIRL